MEDYLTLAALMRFGYAVAAVIMVVAMSMWLDGRARKSLRTDDDGLGWRGAIASIRDNPIAAAIYYGARFVGICLLAGMVIGCTAVAAGPAMTDRYDGQIRKSVATWWGDYPHWAGWKAQLWQESRLNPRAVSPVGAAGLAQFMPATWSQVVRELRLPPEARVDSDLAIDAGAYYMAKQRKAWSSPRPIEDRQQLAQASYNAGLGNILAAQRACRGAVLYDDIIACLPAITGRHSRETIDYVDRVAKWRAMIEAGL